MTNHYNECQRRTLAISWNHEYMKIQTRLQANFFQKKLAVEKLAWSKSSKLSRGKITRKNIFPSRVGFHFRELDLDQENHKLFVVVVCFYETCYGRELVFATFGIS